MIDMITLPFNEHKEIGKRAYIQMGFCENPAILKQQPARNTQTYIWDKSGRNYCINRWVLGQNKLASTTDGKTYLP